MSVGRAFHADGPEEENALAERGSFSRSQTSRSLSRLDWDVQTVHATILRCVDSSESNVEAVRLVRQLKLQENLHMIRMYRNGAPELLSHRVFAITSIDVCGF